MKHHALRWILVVLFASTAACSQQESSPSGSTDSMEAQDGLSPNVSPTAAPGVAFDYRYRFGMPDARITAAQEAHAAACERLGIARCRITGMTYDLDERERVRASLALSIDAALARGFGKQAIGEVDRAGGQLRSAAITGEDQNPALDAAAARARDAETAARSIDTSVNESTGSVDRSILRDQARIARSDAQIAREQGAATRARIASTPMHFFYGGGGAGRGFGGTNPVTEAWYLFVDSLATMIAFGLKALALLLPWLALIILGIVAFRSRLARKLRAWWADNSGEPRYGEEQAP